MINLLLYVSSACSSKETLNFFFDGVQDSDSTRENNNLTIKTDSVKNKNVNKLKNPIAFIHPPYKEKLCDNCHNSNFSNKLVNEIPELCYQCHIDFRNEYTNLHYPVDSGECTVCHHPHQAKYSNLLLKPIGELCEECHDVDELIKGDLHEGISKDDCMDCHNPHGSNDSALMK